MESIKPALSRFVEIIKVNYLVVIALSAVLFHLAPYYIFGQNVFIGVHDTFESNVVWYKVLTESGMLFSGPNEIVPIIMNGLPRISFGSEFNVLIWLFYLFEPFTAYVLNLTAMHLVGFFGMFLLLKTHFLPDKKYDVLSLGVAVCFAILPLWPPAGLSISSLPLAMYAFLNIRRSKASWKDMVILLLIPFYSSLVYTYLFFLIMMGSLWLWDIVTKRTVSKKFFLALGMMSIEFLLIEYRLVLGMLLGDGFISHRLERRIVDYNTLEVLTTALRNLILGQYHASTLHGLIILMSVVLAIIVILASRMNIAKKPLIVLVIGGIAAMCGALAVLGFTSSVSRIYGVLSGVLFGSLYPISIIGALGACVLLIVLLFILTKRYEPIRLAIKDNFAILVKLSLLLSVGVLISLWYGFWFSSFWVPLKQDFALLQAFQFSRFNWLHPLIYYLIFAVAIRVINDSIHFNQRQLGKILALALILLQLTVLLPTTWATVSMEVAHHDAITYRQFYAENLFQNIEDDIGLDQASYRVINIGFHPAIAQFNGFYTLDGYSNNYPLEYKHGFRNIISYELDKDSILEDYFDNMGSRCYVLVDELDLNFMYTKDSSTIINNLELNTTALHEMNCSYIFSAVNITNYVANGLQFNGFYEHNDSAWDIYVYEVI